MKVYVNIQRRETRTRYAVNTLLVYLSA